MNNEGKDEEREGIATQRFRPNEPRGTGEDEYENLDYHRAVERLQLIKG